MGPHSIMRVDVAGRDVTRYLRLLLRKEGVNFRTTAEFEIVRTIKERACYLASNPAKEEAMETERVQYTLPDGSQLDIGPARFRAPEVLKLAPKDIKIRISAPQERLYSTWIGGSILA